MAQVVGNTAQGGQVATQAQNTANQGWTGKQTCADGSDPNGKRLSCRYVGSDGSVGYYNLYEGSCGPGEQTVTEWNHDTCTDGTKPITTQPGQVTGQVFNSGIDSSGKLTTAANDIAGLLDAFLNSLLNSLASDAITTAGGALQNLGSGGGSGGGGTGGSGGGSAGGGQAGQVPISCTATAQNQANPNSITFMGAGGQSISANGGQVSTSQPSYSWSVPGGTPAVGTGGNFTTTLNASGTYTATMTDTNPADGGVTARCSVTIP
jgi:hypothetical protein